MVFLFLRNSSYFSETTIFKSAFLFYLRVSAFICGNCFRKFDDDDEGDVRDADLVAYITSWGVQVGSMPEPARPELQQLADQVCQLRYRATREINGQENFAVWSFAIIDDLLTTRYGA